MTKKEFSCSPQFVARSPLPVLWYTQTVACSPQPVYPQPTARSPYISHSHSLQHVSCSLQPVYPLPVVRTLVTLAWVDINILLKKKKKKKKCVIRITRASFSSLYYPFLLLHIRLKKKICVSKLPPAFVFLCPFDLAKFRLFFFFLKLFFFCIFTTKNEESLLFWKNLSTYVGAQKTCKIPFDFWKYGSWNFSVIFGFGCAWRQRPIAVKKK